MLRHQLEDIVWLEFELLKAFKRLSHGVFLRHGGFGSGPYRSLNLGYSLLNPQENEFVKKNREKLKKLYGFKDLIDSNLEHKDKIIDINATNKNFRFSCDGLSTQLAETPLLVTHADCQAAIFYDPIHHIAANVHAGWRGNVQNIYCKTVEFLKNHYHSSPQNLHVAISPSLGPQDAEFVHYKTEFPETFWEFQTKPCYFDLWSISRFQLKQAGVLDSHIQIASISTFSNPQDYFSYRQEKISGRHGTYVMLHP